MIAGKPPYTGATGVDVIYKHVHEAIPSIAAITPEVDCPVAVEAIVRRCLAKSRDERYGSMDELLVHLKDALRLVTGTSTSGDSLAEAVKELRESAGKKKPGTSGKVRIEEILPSAIANAPTASTPPHEVREVGFRDHLLVEDPTPMGHLSHDRIGETSGPSPRPSRIPLAVSALGFVVALLTLAYVTVIGPSMKRAAEEQPRTAATTVATKHEAQIRFTSDPVGAEVLDGPKALGKTPLVLKLPVASETDPPHQFVFKHAGYKDATKSVRIGPLTGAIDASLEPVEKAIANESEANAADEDDDLGTPAIDDHGREGHRAKKKKASASQTKAATKKDPRYRQNPY
jgi:serine/threonine-protein kinase